MLVHTPRAPLEPARTVPGARLYTLGFVRDPHTHLVLVRRARSYPPHSPYLLALVRIVPGARLYSLGFVRNPRARLVRTPPCARSSPPRLFVPPVLASYLVAAISAAAAAVPARTPTAIGKCSFSVSSADT